MPMATLAMPDAPGRARCAGQTRDRRARCAEHQPVTVSLISPDPRSPIRHQCIIIESITINIVARYNYSS